MEELDRFLLYNADKVLHILTCYSLTMTIGIFKGIRKAVIISMFIGIFKEIMDSSYGRFCMEDIYADCIGIVAAAALLTIRIIRK